jgi:hypothetical protein
LGCVELGELGREAVVDRVELCELVVAEVEVRGVEEVADRSARRGWKGRWAFVGLVNDR